MSSDKLLVIGAGPVGLAMARALKAHGIAYDQVDANDGLGGNWRRGVFKTTHIISSKRTTAFADYPMPDDYPDFPSAAQMLAYLQDYARAHDLTSAITCNREVSQVRPGGDGSWRVVFADGEEARYKGVVVCNGHHWDRRMPEVPGRFTGELIHSKDYFEPSQLAGKRVLVIGGGNSACDVACEAARVGASCDWSLRSGYWFLPKIAFGRPLTDLPIWWLPVFMQRLVLRAIIRMVIGDYKAYGLPSPTHKLFDRHPTFGTEVLAYVRQGLVQPRGPIERYDGDTVRFSDGSSGRYDMIVAATGFRNTFPFLPAGLVDVVNDTAQIYSGAFPAGARGLYIVGSNQPRNGFGAIVTPAADLFARMIRMQDELQHGIGDILQWTGEKPPLSNLLDPGQAKREIWFGKRMLFMLRIYDRLMSRGARRRAEAGAASADRTPAAASSRPAAPPADVAADLTAEAMPVRLGLEGSPGPELAAHQGEPLRIAASGHP